MIFNTIGLEWIFSAGAIIGVCVLILLILGALALVGGIVFAIVSTVIKNKKRNQLEGNNQ